MWQKLKNYYHFLQAMTANVWYGFPSRKLTVIGVTGTDGKTTTASFIYQILKASGKKVALISTVGAYIGDRVYDVGFHVTNPAPFPLQRFIARAAASGHEYLVLEVTSHGLDQNRIAGIRFTVGVLTNITHEHLDYHKTYQEYVRAKMKLLERSVVRVVNKEDTSYGYVKSSKFKAQSSKLKIPNPEVRSQKSKVKRYESNVTSQSSEVQDTRSTSGGGIMTYAVSDKTADVTPRTLPFSISFPEPFNVSNCLAAIAACRAQGIPEGRIEKAVKHLVLPVGRVEKVYEGDFNVIVDFAHTPNAFAQVLPAVRKRTKGRLIHVFSSAAKRDASKRPLMGREASKYDDIIILTAEDPRGEPVSEINAQVKSGIQGFAEYNVREILERQPQRGVVEVENRKNAIDLAVRMAKPGDTVLATGKAHEKSMNYGHGEEPWDEFAVVKQAVKNRLSAGD